MNTRSTKRSAPPAGAATGSDESAGTAGSRKKQKNTATKNTSVAKGTQLEHNNQQNPEIQSSENSRTDSASIVTQNSVGECGNPTFTQKALTDQAQVVDLQVNIVKDPDSVQQLVEKEVPEQDAQKAENQVTGLQERQKIELLQLQGLEDENERLTSTLSVLGDKFYHTIHRLQNVRKDHQLLLAALTETGVQLERAMSHAYAVSKGAAFKALEVPVPVTLTAPDPTPAAPEILDVQSQLIEPPLREDPRNLPPYEQRYFLLSASVALAQGPSAASRDFDCGISAASTRASSPAPSVLPTSRRPGPKCRPETTAQRNILFQFWISKYPEYVRNLTEVTPAALNPFGDHYILHVNWALSNSGNTYWKVFSIRQTLTGEGTRNRNALNTAMDLWINSTDYKRFTFDPRHRALWNALVKSNNRESFFDDFSETTASGGTI